VGLREGSWLKVDGDQVIVKGEFSARLFKQKNQIAEELETGTDISYVKKNQNNYVLVLKNDKLSRVL
jgi:dipeptidase E